LALAACAGAVAALSLFAKESTLGLVLLLPGLLLVPSHASWGRVRRRALVCWASLGLGSVLFFLMRSTVQVAMPQRLAEVSPAHVLFAELRLLRLAFWPTELSLMRPVPTDAGLGDLLAGGALVLALTWGFVARRRLAGRLVLAGGSILLLGTLPGAVAAACFDLLPDRYIYIGFLGAPLLAGGLLEGLRGSDRRLGRLSPEELSKMTLVVLAVVLLVGVYSGLRQSPRWVDDLALFSHEVELWPEIPQSHYHLGLSQRNVGDHVSAEASLRKAILHGPGLWQSWGELAVTSLDREDYEQARWALEEGIRATAGHPKLIDLLGLLPKEAERRGLKPADENDEDSARAKGIRKESGGGLRALPD